MTWSDLAMQFCLQLAFGVLFALAFVPKAPVGKLFYRVMGTAALVPLLAAVVLPLWITRTFDDPAVALAGVGVLAYPLYASFAGPMHARRWAVALGVALVATAVGVGWIVARSSEELGAAGLALATLSALATGAVAGSVGLAMVLGHWYLTVPKLEVRHLVRLNRVTVASLVASALLVGGTCLVLAERLNTGRDPLFAPFGLFHLGTRVVVGIVFPLIFAAMASSSLRFQNTRSATGILYASTVLVLIGTAVSISLQDSYGVPL